MSLPVPAGCEIYEGYEIPHVRVDIHPYETYGEYKVSQLSINSIPLTKYFQGVKDLGLLGRLLLDKYIREVLTDPGSRIRVEMRGAHKLPDKGATLLGYVLVRFLSGTAGLYSQLQYCYREFLEDFGYEIGNLSLPMSPQKNVVVVPTHDLISIMRFAGKQDPWSSHELHIKAVPNGASTLVVFSRVGVLPGTWSDVRIEVPELRPWSAVARLNLFATDLLLELCLDHELLDGDGHVAIEYSPSQDLLRLSQRRWSVVIPTLEYNVLSMHRKSIATKEILDLFRITLDEQRENLTGRPSKPRALIQSPEASRPNANIYAGTDTPIPSAVTSTPEFPFTLGDVSGTLFDFSPNSTYEFPSHLANKEDRYDDAIVGGDQTVRHGNIAVEHTSGHADKQSPDLIASFEDSSKRGRNLNQSNEQSVHRQNPSPDISGHSAEDEASISLSTLSKDSKASGTSAKSASEFDSSQQFEWGIERLSALFEPKGIESPEKRDANVPVFDRDPNVVAFVRLRSTGCCEICGWQGFIKDDGSRYIEVHHIVPLSEGGPDTLENTAALCPNCHKAIHFSRDRAQLIDEIIEKLRC